MNKNEFIIYLNSYLEPIEILNTIPNCAKDYGFKEVPLKEDNLELSLKEFLKTPNWIFKFEKLDENWLEIVTKNSSWAFNAVIHKVYKRYEITNDNFENLVEKHNLKNIQNGFTKILENFMKLYENFEVYQVNIDNQFDNDGYFAHGEYNVLFKTSDNDLFLLYFRDSD